MPHPTPIGIKYEVLALAHEGIRQSAIAGRMGLTRAIINRILWRHVATGTLVPGKSTGTPRKTTPGQNCALTGSLHKFSLLDGAGEEFVWNEG